MWLLCGLGQEARAGTAVAVPASHPPITRAAAGDLGARPTADDELRLARWPDRIASPDFQLRDTRGRLRTLKDFRGSPAVVTFGYTSCPDVCPAELAKLAQVRRRLGADGPLQVLFITLDPRRDLPARLEQYVRAFDPRFVALTGSTQQIQRAAARFAVEYALVPVGNSYSLDHSSGFFLFDPSGRLRAVAASNVSIDDLVHDLTSLARESAHPDSRPTLPPRGASDSTGHP